MYHNTICSFSLALRHNFDVYRDILISIAGMLLIAIFAQFSIPLNPVPITLHTVAVLFIGYTCTPSQAVSAICLYILASALGLPVQAGMQGGLDTLLGASGGYIVGFIPAVYFLAKTRMPEYIGGCIAMMIIYLCGVLWLSQYTGLSSVLTYGVIPFVLPGICKIILLVSMLKLVKRF